MRVLVPFTPRHLTQKYVSWLNDGDLMRYSEQRHRKHTFDTCRRYIDGCDMLWAIEAPDYVGTVAVHIDMPNNLADVGILCSKSGNGKAAWEEALNKLTPRYRVTAGHMETNVPMMKICERTMKPWYVVPDRFLVDGEKVDSVHWIA